MTKRKGGAVTAGKLRRGGATTAGRLRVLTSRGVQYANTPGDTDPGQAFPDEGWYAGNASGAGLRRLGGATTAGRLRTLTTRGGATTAGRLRVLTSRGVQYANTPGDTDPGQAFPDEGQGGNQGYDEHHYDVPGLQDTFDDDEGQTGRGFRRKRKSSKGVKATGGSLKRVKGEMLATIEFGPKVLRRLLVREGLKKPRTKR